MQVSTCRSCDSSNVTKVVDLGEQYISDFREDASKPPKYPIRAFICEDCKLVQLDFNTPQVEMYHQNYGFKSGISNSIKDDLKDNVEQLMKFVPEPNRWLDIASNDGTLLSYVPGDTYTVGVDPVGFLCEQAKEHAHEIHNDYFDKSLFESDEKFDAITSISCFYDMPNPNKFVSDVASVLAENGVWDIQQNYLLPTMQLGAVDNFCHEHLEYYTLMSLEPLLERHGLEVIDLSTSMVNGGSIRTFVAHKGDYEVQDSVERQRAIELDAGVDKVETYKKFAEDAEKNISKLKQLVKKFKDEGKKVAILAASTRGATIWQCAGFGPDTIEYAVERNPEKVGKQFSAIGIPIVSEEKFREDKPEVAIIGPWFFAPEIVDREVDYLSNGGCLVVPLPEVQEIWKS